jgi:hypothetical protein
MNANKLLMAVAAEANRTWHHGTGREAEVDVIDLECRVFLAEDVFAKFGWGRTPELGRWRRSLRRRRATGSSPRCGIERSAV